MLIKTAFKESVFISQGQKLYKHIIDRSDRQIIMFFVLKLGNCMAENCVK